MKNNIWESRINEIHGELKVLQYLGNSKVNCQCSCGELTVKNYYDMKKGKIKSCGHLLLKRQLRGLEGTRYHKLLVMEYVGIINNDTYYIFKCDCGKLIKRAMTEVKRGKIKSCGCGKIEAIKDSNTKHGDTGTKLYNAWKSMKARCYNKSHNSYHQYGGRGIFIIEEWLNYDNFKNWALINGFESNLSIDRIDNDGSYSPTNCRWVNMKVQANNKSNNIYINYKNEIKTLSEWCECLNLNYHTVHKRINLYGYSPEKAISYNLHKVSEFNEL